MTAAASSNSFPFEFAPQPAQDANLLRDLSFVPGLKEALCVRQVHALEHATVWVLSQAGRGSATADDRQLSGMSTPDGFYLYGNVQLPALRCAVHAALQRLTSGEWDLAIHPRCGTNLSVGMLMTAGLAIGVTLVLPKGPIEQLLGLGVAATAAMHLAPDVGSLAQRYITTAIPFNLAIEEIRASTDTSGQLTHFVRVRWVES